MQPTPAQMTLSFEAKHSIYKHIAKHVQRFYATSGAKNSTLDQALWGFSSFAFFFIKSLADGGDAFGSFAVIRLSQLLAGNKVH